MSSLSQPQTPASAGNPPLEYRTPPVKRVTDQLETPWVDDRSYRVVRLANQLEVLLVHDAETDKASAAMDVNVGSFSDPEDFSGVAHAVEHVLFMGTKKYPIENAYHAYLSAHSGNSNAYTASTSTNYFFEVAAKSAEGSTEASPLYGALDRFAQFFIEPLFLASTLDRELYAVDSENKKNLQSDTWRLHQLDRSLSNPKHPYCHFSTGNLQTLKILPEAKGIDVRQEFMKFYDEHYSANRMKLVVLGREPLDTLERWVAELFSGVKDKDLPQLRWEAEQPLGKNELLMQYFAKPVMDSRVLTLHFPFLEQEKLYKTQPGRYLSHLIGHEGPGSIMSYIKAKGWANSLSAYPTSVCAGNLDIFVCQIRLTEDGLKQYKEIVKVFFQYVSLLQQTTPQQWIFEEQKGMAEVDFKFKQKTPASKFTSSISSVMQRPLPREWLLSSHYLFRKFDQSLIQKALSYLRPDNFRIALVSQKFPGDWDKVEPWYGTEYKYEKLSKDFLVEIEQAASTTANDRLPELHLPHKNQFIPTNLEVEKKDIKESAISPKLIRNDDLFRAWFKKDDTFWVPKANLFIKFRNPLPYANVENALKASVYTDMVRDALEEYAYDADLAGLEYNVSSTLVGLEIHLAGYNDKVSVLLEKVLTTMRDLVIMKDRFAIVKERILRGMRNYDFQQPYYQVGDFMQWLTSEKIFINDQYLAELPHLTFEDIQPYYPQLLRQMHVETLVHGNLYKEDALRINSLIENTIRPRPLPQAEWPVSRSLILPPGSNFVYRRTLKDPKNVNHCIEYLLHVGDKTDRLLRAKALLWDQMTHEPVFDQLRTKEQLGYVVFSGYLTTASTIDCYLLVQSEKTPEYLETRIETFLEGYEQTLRLMKESEFEGHKRSLITKRLEKLKNLGQESNRLWTHISNRYFDFEQATQDAAHVKSITKDDMIDFFQRYISPSSPARSKLSVHLHARSVSGDSSPAEATVSDLLTPGVSIMSLGSNITQGTTDMRNGSKNEVDVSKSKPDLINDVEAFKAKLTVGPVPKPVRDLTDFEDLEAML